MYRSLILPRDTLTNMTYETQQFKLIDFFFFAKQNLKKYSTKLL